MNAAVWKMQTNMNIEKQILDSSLLVAVDREEVRGWVETECKRTRRVAFTKLVATLVLVGLLGLVYLLLEIESNKVRHLVRNQRPVSLVVLGEITAKLCDEPPAEYWVNQLNFIYGRD